MNYKKERVLLALLGSIIIMAISTNYYLTNLSDSFFQDRISLDIDNPYTHGYWDLTGTPISIDNTVPTKNWSYTADNYDWCSGSGTWSDPYVIENVTIFGQNIATCIEIKNSNDYFVIRNCTLFNSSSAYQHAAIKLDHANNGEISNNTCFNNLFAGILLIQSDNNSIVENNADLNDIGIYSFFSDNNTISGNKANNNDIAISIYFSDIHIVKENVANEGTIGIYVHAGNNNKLLNNTLNNHERAISFDSDNYNNYLSGNEMVNCGIRISGDLIEEFSTNTMDSTNLVNNRPLYNYISTSNLNPGDFLNAGQIILVNCSNSVLSGVNTSSGSMGISLYFCQHITVSNNFASKNSKYGIYFHKCEYNLISNNTSNYNTDRGIVLGASNHSIIAENTANENGYYGITLSYSHNNTVIENIGNSNQDSGVEIYYSNNNSISKNMLTNNKNGVYLSGSYNNSITENIANFNSGHGIGVFLSDLNLISNNIAHNNSYGIYLFDSNNNTIRYNQLFRNNIDCIRELSCTGNIIENNQCAPEITTTSIPGYAISFLMISLIGIIFSILVKNRKQMKLQ